MFTTGKVLHDSMPFRCDKEIMQRRAFGASVCRDNILHDLGKLFGFGPRFKVARCDGNIK